MSNCRSEISTYLDSGRKSRSMRRRPSVSTERRQPRNFSVPIESRMASKGSVLGKRPFSCCPRHLEGQVDSGPRRIGSNLPSLLRGKSKEPERTANPVQATAFFGVSHDTPPQRRGTRGDNGTRETSAPDPWRALGCPCDIQGWGAAGIDGGLCLRAGVRRVPLASEPSL